MNNRTRFTIGRELARECWNLLTQNKEWLKIPLFSAVGVAIVTVIFGIVSAVVFGKISPSSDSQPSGGQVVIGVVLLFLYYFATYSIVIYSETAMVSVVLMKMRGQKAVPVAADGFALANQRLPAIFGFAALSATVGVISRMIMDSGGKSKNLVVMIIAALFATLLQGAWVVVTLMVTPVISAENLGTFPAISRSWALFKQTWGEQIGARFSLGFFGCMLTLGAMLPGLLIALVCVLVNAPCIVFGWIGEVS